MRIESLEYLIEINKYKSITQASKHLYITQQSLSTAVSAIEQELGYKIFKRTPQGVFLTSKGEKIIKDTTEILKIYKTWSEPEIDDQNIYGDVYITGTPFCKTFMVKIISELNTQYPNINIYFNEVRKQDFLNYLQYSSTSIALLSAIPDELDSFQSAFENLGLQMEILYEDIHMGIISTQNPKANQNILTKKELEDMVFATFIESSDKTTNKIINFLPEKTKRLHVNSDSLIWQFVANNVAVSIGPTCTAYDNYYITSNMIKFIKIEEFEFSSFHYIMFPNALSIAEQKIIESIRSYYANLQPYSTVPDQADTGDF